MWFERFVIIVTSLHRDYLPSSWTMFSPTFVDIGIFIGTIGFFFVLFLLYSRTFPVIAQAEVKTILKSSGQRYKNIREAGGSLVGTGSDERTSKTPKATKKPKKKKD
jgi:molybdopterin-containing oxidoreductase family membrane subunit